MLKIMSNVPFIEIEGNTTHYGKQLKFFGFSIAAKYYTHSKEKLPDGRIKRTEYMWGFRELKTSVKTYQPNEDGTLKPVGKWMYYQPLQKGENTVMNLYETKEFDRNGKLKKENHYSRNSYKTYNYNENGGLSSLEEYKDKQVVSRIIYKGGERVFERYSKEGKNKVHIVRREKQSNLLSEIRTVTDKNGDLIEQKNYTKAPNGLFFCESSRKDEKTQYSLVKRSIADDIVEIYSEEIYSDVCVLATVPSKQMLFKIYTQMLALEKASDKKRQTAIELLRKKPTLQSKKLLVLAFRAMEKSR